MKHTKVEWKNISPNASVTEYIIEKYIGYNYTIIIDSNTTAAKVTPIAVAITGLSTKDVTAVVNRAYRVNGQPADVKGKRMISKNSTNKNTDYLRFKTLKEANDFIDSLSITAAQKALIKAEEL